MVARTTVCIGIAACITACTEHEIVTPGVDASVASVDVSPGALRLAVDDTVRLQAVALDASGATVPAATFRWTTRKPSLVSVSSGGTAKARSLSAGVTEDTAWIVASAGTVSDSTRIVVADSSLMGAPRMGTNLDMLADWTTEWPFTDLFRQSRRWISNRTGAAWGQGGTLALSPEQQVLSLESAQWATSIVLTDGGGHQPGGEYVILWDGDGEMSFDRNPGVTVLTTAANRTTARLTPGTPAFVSLRRTNPANPVRNIRIVAARDEASYATRPFNPDFLRVIRPFGVIRFMNWQQMQQDPPGDWSRRATPDFATFAGPWGASVESMVALANEAGADAWFCMPHTATDDYMRQFATLVRSSLSPNRKVYVEFSNEIWNGIFVQSNYARDRGAELGLSQDRFLGALRWQSQRSVRMFQIWREVFGADSTRVVRVMAAQSANPWTAEQVLGWQDAFRVTDVIAIAPYFGGRFGGRDGSAEAAMSETRLLDLLAEEIETTTRGFIEAYARLARSYGVRLVAYEGGQHLVSADVQPQYLDAVTRLFMSVNRSPRMGDLYRRYFEIWYQSGGDLFMNFVAVAGYSRYGSWGDLEYVHQDPATSPKYQAVIEAAARWGR